MLKLVTKSKDKKGTKGRSGGATRRGGGRGSKAKVNVSACGTVTRTERKARVSDGEASDHGGREGAGNRAALHCIDTRGKK